MKAGSCILRRFLAAIMPQMKIPPVDMKVNAQSPVLAPYEADKDRQSLLANRSLLFLRHLRYQRRSIVRLFHLLFQPRRFLGLLGVAKKVVDGS